MQTKIIAYTVFLLAIIGSTSMGLAQNKETENSEVGESIKIVRREHCKICLVLLQVILRV